MEIHLEIIGWLFITLSGIHVIFPGYFKWKTELVGLSLMNRQMMYVHTFFIALTVFMMGLLCVSSADLLINSELGKNVTLGLAVFWTVRLFIQFFVYSPDLWRGKAFETSVHILFAFLWLYCSIVFWMAYLI